MSAIRVIRFIRGFLSCPNAQRHREFLCPFYPALCNPIDFYPFLCISIHSYARSIPVLCKVWRRFSLNTRSFSAEIAITANASGKTCGIERTKKRTTKDGFLPLFYCGPIGVLPESYCDPTRLLLELCAQEPSKTRRKPGIVKSKGIPRS